MKNLIYLISVSCIILFSCNTPKNTVATTEKEEPVRIANDSLEYEIVIIDIGFANYLAMAKPMSYYSLNTLEVKNKVYVSEWNSRVRQPSRFDTNVYENIIDYQFHIDYGMEVNYKLYQYFQFAQKKYKMRLGSYRID